MMIVLDTNVISEALRPAPDPAVFSWMRSIARREFWTSTVVLAELFSGVDLMPAGKRQLLLHDAMERLVSTLFAGKVLDFDIAAARAYGSILAGRLAIGRPITETDAQIAACASVRGARIATRYVRDFEHCGIEIINPWQMS